MHTNPGVARADSELSTLYDRVQSIIDTAVAEKRDLSANELAECRRSRERMEHLADTIDVGEQTAQIAQRVGIVDAALHTRSATRRFTPTLVVGEAHLRSHLAAITSGGVFGATEDLVGEQRSLLTAAGDVGSATTWTGGSLAVPRNLVEFSGVPVTELTGRKASVPSFTAPSGEAGADEGVPHPEFDDVVPVDLVALRYGRWSDVSSIVAELDDLRSLNQVHGWGLARDVDKVAISSLSSAAGAATPGGADLAGAVREAVLEVSANTYTDPTQLVVVGAPVDLSDLMATTPTNGGDLGSVAVRINGARVYATMEGVDGAVIVFAPNAFRCFQSTLRSASTIDPTSGSQRFGQWLHSTPLAAQISGAALAVSTSGS